MEDKELVKKVREIAKEFPENDMKRALLLGITDRFVGVKVNSIPISVIQNKIEELEEEIEQLERRQNEIIGCDGDDTLTREEIWFIEDKIHLLKKLLESEE